MTDLVPQIFSQKKLLKHKLSSKDCWKNHNFLFNLTSEIILERLESTEQQFKKIYYYNNGEDIQIENYLSKKSDCKNYKIVSLNSELNKNCDFTINPENLILAEEEIDLFVTNLNMHWINDLPGFLFNIRKNLSDKGVFIGAAFGRNSLKELRKSLFLMQSELNIGFSDHISPFIDSQNAAQLLTRAGFGVRVSDSEEIKISYKKLSDLFLDLKNMGENNCLNEKTIFFNKERLSCLEKIYQKEFSCEDGIYASFEIIFFFGVK